MTEIDLYRDYLAHHGVKGQKWGVRRYQNEDGTLTAEGKTRYAEDKSEKPDKSPKSKSEKGTRKKPVRSSEKKKPDTSKNNGEDQLSEEERKQKRRKKALAVLGIAAGVTLAAVAVHKYRKSGLEFEANLEKGVDPLRPFKKDLESKSAMAYAIPAGTHLQRMSLYDEADSKGHAYVTFDPRDNERYKGFFGKNLERRVAAQKLVGNSDNSKIYVHDIVAKDMMLSPSQRTRIETFLEMYADNPTELGDTLGNYHTREWGNRGYLPAYVYRKQYKQLRGTDKVTKGYSTFVKALGDSRNDRIRDDYFRRLTQKGYNMIRDDQDAGRYGFMPSIVLDRQASTLYGGKRELFSEEIDAALKKYGRKIPRKYRHREWES